MRHLLEESPSRAQDKYMDTWWRGSIIVAQEVPNTGPVAQYFSNQADCLTSMVGIGNPGVISTVVVVSWDASLITNA